MSIINIALIGLSGSGKTTLAKYLVKNYQFNLQSTGNICREISILLYQSTERKYLNLITDALKSADENVFSNASLKNMDKNNVFDSIRYPLDYDIIRDKNYLIIKMECPRKLSLSRLMKRSQKFTSTDLRHESETNAECFPYDVVFDNSGTICQLYRQIDEFMLRMQNEDKGRLHTWNTAF